VDVAGQVTINLLSESQDTLPPTQPLDFGGSIAPSHVPSSDSGENDVRLSSAEALRAACRQQMAKTLATGE
jgi:hypothetical protein